MELIVKICKLQVHYLLMLLNIKIDNLKGITEKTCKNRYEGFLDEYCKKCSNYNCNLNKNTKK